MTQRRASPLRHQRLPASALIFFAYLQEIK
jgi:hypothetical protein